jgi:hypothetical protein
MGHGVAGIVKDKTTDATDAVSSAASDLGAKATQFANRSRNTFEDLVDRNPLLVAGVGLALGAFIAASLPSSDAENRMFGERSDDLKDKAREAASQGVERAKNVATDMMDEMTGAAAREGLDGEGLAKAVQGATERVKSVVDKGVKTALGEAETSSAPRSPSSFQSNS